MFDVLLFAKLQQTSGKSKLFIFILKFHTLHSAFFCSFARGICKYTALEKLLHYTWKHRLFPLTTFTTTDGKGVEVLDPGLQNHNAGPDFFNAKIKIDGMLWVGNVELHVKSGDWFLHGHHCDTAYDNIILHVVCDADREVVNSRGEQLPQMVLPIADGLRHNYEALLREDKYPRCHNIIPELPAFTVHSWMSALQTERLERKTDDIMRLVKQLCGDWEAVCFRTLARNYGFGVNSDAFEEWAKHIPLRAVDHHRDDLFQIEAIFLGQTGLLDINAAPHSHQKEMAADTYFHRLTDEYRFLAHKFSLEPMDAKMWKFLRLRPQNFPYIRISQLAYLYHSERAGMSRLVECKDIKELAAALATQVSDYWQTHYVFGVESETKNEKHMAMASLELLMINTVIPMLFAYGRYKNDETLVDRAVDLLESLRPENNNIVRLWRECGLEVGNAGDSQALIQLKKEYCDKKECLRCRIGYQYLKRK